MARMRSLKPEFWLDRKLARSLSRDERMLYLALWNQADEWARAQADPRLVKGQTFPYDDDVTLDVIDDWMDALERAQVLQRYEVDGDPYLFLPKLAKHQRLEPAKVPSRLPEPPPRGSDQHVQASPEVRANESARDANLSEPGADTLPLKHVAGGMEHVAGQRRADRSARTVDKPSADASEFEEFWELYPRKIAKPAARKAWKAAIKRADASVILAGLRRTQFRDDPQFVPHPATWLNQDRWADEATSLRLVPTDRRLTADEVTNALGPDRWNPPPPPPGMTSDEEWEWRRQQSLVHIAERQAEARARMTGVGA